MISSDWRYDLIIHDMTGEASLPVFFVFSTVYFILIFDNY